MRVLLLAALAAGLATACRTYIVAYDRHRAALDALAWMRATSAALLATAAAMREMADVMRAAAEATRDFDEAWTSVTNVIGNDP